MTSAFQTSIQAIPHYGQQTSLDLARNRAIPALATGIKRKYSEYSAQTPSNASSIIQPRKAFQAPQTTLQASRIRLVADTTTTASKEIPSEYSQRTAVRSTPGPSQNPLLSLCHSKYGLPPVLVANFEALGVRSIYPWQSACLLGKGLLAGEGNLIYTAPTGGGKSLIADVLLLKKIIDNPTKKAILVLPYVALVQEKLRWLRKATENVSKNAAAIEDHPQSKYRHINSSVRVAGFYGGSRAKATWSDIDIAVCTIEKANSLVNAAIEEGAADQLGIVVLDELHMLDDENRGYIMELMITKLLSLDHGIQLIGMSATLSNPKMLADWMQAKFYVSKYRPIPISEYLVYDNSIYSTQNTKDFFRTASQLNGICPTQKPPNPFQTIEVSTHKELESAMNNAVVALAVETAVKGYGALVFCSSRQGSQTMASLIAQAMPPGTPEILDKRMDMLAALQALPGGFESTFTKTIMSGVGFHHAGLTVEERDIVAESYDQGILQVMVATCSLAAGINLPARRVILNGARMGRDLVGPAMLRQMRGRAGRKGKDEVGESYLCCQKQDLEAVADLLEAEMPPVESCLTPEKRGVKRALLEVIAIRLATTRDSINDYIHRSLLWQTTDHNEVLAMVDVAMQELIRTELIQQTEHGNLEPTKLGSAIVAASLTPEDGIFVHKDMLRALQSFVMDGEMHIFYLFTPVQIQDTNIDWQAFRQQLETLDDSGIRALRCVGISPAFVNRIVTSGAALPTRTDDEINLARIYSRAYAAFQLRDICNEIPIHKISTKYEVPRGSVQNLAQTCHGFAAGMVKFCDRMGWGMLSAVLEHMIDRLRAGARADLLEMAQVVFVKSRMARILWENGFKSVRALAEARAEDLVPVMMLAQGRKAKVQGEAAEKLRAKLLEKAEVIVGSANRLWEKQQLVELEE